jgi:hypothetical protein
VRALGKINRRLEKYLRNVDKKKTEKSKKSIKEEEFKLKE